MGLGMITKITDYVPNGRAKDAAVVEKSFEKEGVVFWTEKWVGVEQGSVA